MGQMLSLEQSRMNHVEERGFGKNISQLITTRQKTNSKKFVSNHVPNKGEINFDVFGASMKNRIGSQVSSSNIITPQHRGGGDTHTQFT
jgi:hypothetical protein